MNPQMIMMALQALQGMGGGQSKQAEQPRQSPFFQPSGGNGAQVMQSTPPTNYDSMIRSMLQQRRGF